MRSLISRAQQIAEDHDAGASELSARLLPLLAEAIPQGESTTLEVARAICSGQPAMASLWNACAAAVAEHRVRGQFARVRAEMERAPAALTRAASSQLRELLQDCKAPHVLTVSFSSSVERVLTTLLPSMPLRVTCAEGRPRYEGRRLASSLAAAGATVTLTTDAALTTFIGEETVVVVGADAIAAEYWVNKVGTHGVAAAAWLLGRPVGVIASRDKALPRAFGAVWKAPTFSAAEVWSDAPGEITVDNRYFERTPAELATFFLTDSGPLTPSDLPAWTERTAANAALFVKLLSLS